MEKRIYSCATAHLDTIWNWDFEHTVSTCLYNTLHRNFDLFLKYPDYTFNFEGAYRYELFEEYYPKEFEKLRQYVQEGRWCVAGSAYENGDVNVPSPEALFRNILYGNGYFREKFGKESKDIFLPDCFGFGWALPSVIRHANLLGFTTQKLTWGSAYGTPFDIGKWYGADGNFCYAALRPDAYDLTYKSVRDKKDNRKKLAQNERRFALPWTFSFHGVGDQGGAPREKSVAVLQKEMEKNASEEVKVLSAPSDQIYHDLDALSTAQKDKLPSWNQELVMRDHGAGGYTSRAIGKRWNRMCEELADRAERAATAAAYLGAAEYPDAAIRTAYKRAIAHQFHDDLPGTSVQRAYKRSWNDYMLSMNELEHVYASALGATARAMDTSWTHGTPIVVHNSLEQERKDLVKFRITLQNGRTLYAKDRSGKFYPVQILDHEGNTVLAAMHCTLSPLGYKVFDIRETDTVLAVQPKISASKTGMENERYRVSFNENGEIEQIFDKTLGKSLLKEPIRHALIPYFGSKNWPAWELTYKSISSKKMKTPKLRSIRVLYAGAVTAAVEIIQQFGNSTFKSVVTLIAESDRVEVQNELDWWEQKTLLKDVFSLAPENDTATYDLGLGTIQRGNNTEKLFEVPAQKWADISRDDFGVSVISDSKYGWDKPDAHTLRLTVLHTPLRNYHIDSRQGVMDLGLNRYGYAICAHGADLIKTQQEARAFHQPFAAVSTDQHKGILGSVYTFSKLSHKNVLLRAIKKAEQGDEIIVRFGEGANRRTEKIHFKLGDGILSAREVYASEEALGEATVQKGELVFDLDAYGIKTFALTLKPTANTMQPTHGTPILLKGNTELFTAQDASQKPVLKQWKRLTVPKELRPDCIFHNGLDFCLDAEKAVRCKGGKLYLGGKYAKITLLMFSQDQDKEATFYLDDRAVRRTVHSATEPVGQWDLVGMHETARIKNCDVAHVFTHAHSEKNADVLAKQIYVFAYTFEAENVKVLTLPNDADLLLLAATAETERHPEKLLFPLYDRVEERPFQNKMTKKNRMVSLWGLLPPNTSPRAHVNPRLDGYRPK